jgi:exopolysaccharide biosynthesis polyprenyl glycosylphosphotransferase
VGPEASCRKLTEGLAQHPEWNLDFEYVEDVDSLSARCSLVRQSRIIVCADAKLDARILEKLMELKLRGARVESGAQFYEQVTGRVQLDQIGPEWFIFSSGFGNTRRRLLIKRGFDLAVAGGVAVFTTPLMLLAAAAIAIEGKGPVFYRQERVGLHGRKFQILKFRTMIPAPQNATPQWTQNQDKRITRLGQVMRKFRIDELPQLLNVLRGEMSLVGPRPEQPHFCELLTKEIPFYQQRHTVSPGLTGWAQVRYMYGASVEESRRKLEFDLFYVKNLSFWLDLVIAFETLKVVVVGQGAK